MLIFLAQSCQDATTKLLEKKIEQLTQEQKSNYMPGYGEIMLAIQTRHTKLGLAGKAKNWPLAKFAVEEIQEGVQKLRKHQASSPYTQHLTMLDPILLQLIDELEKNQPQQFEKLYQSLTTTCNNCHHTTDHGFINIVVPESNPFYNQDFSPTNEIN